MKKSVVRRGICLGLVLLAFTSSPTTFAAPSQGSMAKARQLLTGGWFKVVRAPDGKSYMPEQRTPSQFSPARDSLATCQPRMGKIVGLRDKLTVPGAPISEARVVGYRVNGAPYGFVTGDIELSDNEEGVFEVSAGAMWKRVELGVRKNRNGESLLATRWSTGDPDKDELEEVVLLFGKGMVGRSEHELVFVGILSNMSAKPNVYAKCKPGQ